MQLKTFLLDLWLEEHEHAARYNLAASTGPSWTVDGLLGLMNEDEKERFLKTPLTYCPGTGHASLRREIAAMYGASPGSRSVRSSCDSRTGSRSMSTP